MSGHQQRPTGIRRIFSESAIQGVLLVSGLILVLARDEYATGPVLLKVVATIVVFWLAHLYAGVVAHLGDETENNSDHLAHVGQAFVLSLEHSWGMLAAAALPTAVLLLGTVGVIGDEAALWGTLWLDVVLLGILGFSGVATYTVRLAPRLVGAAATASLGIVMIVLKSLIH